MTNEEINRAAELISEIKHLEGVLNAKDRELVIAQKFDPKSQMGQMYRQECFPVAPLKSVDVRALATPVLDAMRAELEALRAK